MKKTKAEIAEAPNNPQKVTLQEGIKSAYSARRNAHGRKWNPTLT